MAYHSYLVTCPALPFHSSRQVQWAASEVGLSIVCGKITPRWPRWYGIYKSV